MKSTQGRSLPIRNQERFIPANIPEVHCHGSESRMEGGMTGWPSTSPEDVSVLHPIAGNAIFLPPSDIPFGKIEPVNPVPGSGMMMSVQPIGVKTRVENQIEVQIAIYPVGPSIQRLHLQSHTMTKAKQLAISPPEKSPDMLELHAMLVCSSAMHVKWKQERAFSRAAQPQPFSLSKRRLPLEDAEVPGEFEDTPSEGGPVRLCKLCIEREMKRVARNQKPDKIHKQTVENLKLWEGDASDRAILFNANEIIERYGTSLPKKNAKNRSPDTLNEQKNGPDNAFLINLPMRITCYCRHQDEKIGYRYSYSVLLSYVCLLSVSQGYLHFKRLSKRCLDASHDDQHSDNG